MVRLLHEGVTDLDVDGVCRGQRHYPDAPVAVRRSRDPYRARLPVLPCPEDFAFSPDGSLKRSRVAGQIEEQCVVLSSVPGIVEIVHEPSGLPGLPRTGFLMCGDQAGGNREKGKI